MLDAYKILNVSQLPIGAEIKSRLKYFYEEVILRDEAFSEMGPSLRWILS